MNWKARNRADDQSPASVSSSFSQRKIWWKRKPISSSVNRRSALYCAAYKITLSFFIPIGS